MGDMKMKEIIIIGLVFMTLLLSGCVENIENNIKEQNELITMGAKNTFYDDNTDVMVTQRYSGIYTSVELESNKKYVYSQLQKTALHHPNSTIIEHDFGFRFYIETNESDWNNWYRYHSHSIRDCTGILSNFYGFNVLTFWIIESTENLEEG